MQPEIMGRDRHKKVSLNQVALYFLSVFIFLPRVELRLTVWKLIFKTLGPGKKNITKISRFLNISKMGSSQYLRTCYCVS